MRIPRIPIGFLMLTVVFVATFLAEARAFLAFADGPIANVNSLFFVSPLLTVGNFLAFLLALRVPELWRTGRLRAGPFWSGFQATSWCVFAAFGVACLVLDDHIIENYLMPNGSLIDSALRQIDALLPKIEGTEDAVELGLMSTLFGVPILLFGLLGGLVSWALGIEVELRFRRRRRGERGAVVGPAPSE